MRRQRLPPGISLVILGFIVPAGLFAASDTTPPVLRILSPAPDTEIVGAHLTVELEYNDAGSGIAPESLHIMLNGKDYTGQFDQHSRGADGQIRLPKTLPVGDNRLTVEIADRAGNVARTETQVFYPGRGWLTVAATAATLIPKATAVAVSTDGSTIAYGLEGGSIQVWRATGSKLNQAAVLQGHRGSITALALTDDGKALASGGEDRTVRLWNLTVDAPPEGMVVGRHGLRVTALAIAPDGKTLASGSGDRTVRLWTIMPDQPMKTATLTGHSRVVSCLAFSPDGQKVVSGSADGTVRVWNISSPTLRDPMILSGHLLNVVSVAVAPDGKTVASGSKDRSIRLWDLSASTPKQKILHEWLEQPVKLVALPYGTALLTVHGEDRIALWDIESGTKRTEVGLPSLLYSVALRGSRLVSHHGNGQVYLFNIDYNSPIIP